MYLDELDTVRFDVRKKNYESNIVFAQAAMMKNIIEGKTITLSQTQLFDSGIILKLLEQDAFVKLFETGVINVSVFHKDWDRLKNFKDIVIDKLSQGINGDKRPVFYFSGIDALSDKKLYSDNAVRNIAEPRNIAIQILKSNGRTAVDYPPEQKEYFEGLINFASIINSISKPITEGNLKTVNANRTLSDLITAHLQKSADDNEEYSARDYIQTLKQLFEKLSEKKQENARSAYYTYLENPNYCEAECAEKVKAIVDFYYNFVVGQSVSLSTDNLHELTFYDELLDEHDEKILFDVCKGDENYIVSKKVNYTDTIYDVENGVADNIITWDTINNLPNIPRNTLSDEIHNRFIIYFSTPYNKYHGVICTTASFLFKGIEKLIEMRMRMDPNMQNIINMCNNVIDMGTLIDLMINFADKKIEQLFEESRVKEAKAKQLIEKVRKEALLLNGGQLQ